MVAIATAPEEASMFGRMSFVSGDATRIDDLITYVKTVVKPATDELAGNYGLGMWVNRDTGDALVMTVWEDEKVPAAGQAPRMASSPMAEFIVPLG